MVRQVIWSVRAQNDRKEIFEYWNSRKNYIATLKILFKINISFCKATKTIVPQVSNKSTSQNQDYHERINLKKSLP